MLLFLLNVPLKLFLLLEVLPDHPEQVERRALMERSMVLRALPVPLALVHPERLVLQQHLLLRALPVRQARMVHTGQAVRAALALPVLRALRALDRTEHPVRLQQE
jgi:hypothetical protein